MKKYTTLLCLLLALVMVMACFMPMFFFRFMIVVF